MEFGVIADLIRLHARDAPSRQALVEGRRVLDYAALDALMDRVAASLQRDGLQPGNAMAICAGTVGRPQGGAIPRIALDGSDAGQAFEQWLAAPGARPRAVAIEPDWPFNIIYSSGTTGEPKGIVQQHGMRWAHVRRGAAYGYGADTAALLSTPLYSNTTLVVLFPTLAFGGTVVLMPKFDAARYLQLAQEQRVTHTMLVPVQYQRIMARPDFDTFDLASFQFKFSTSAPFAASLKADVLKRWPGGLVEFYGLTEGGGTCILQAHAHPDKLHTVGQPAPGHDIRLIDEAGREVPAGEAGEVVGHSAGMMKGYHRQPQKTRVGKSQRLNGLQFLDELPRGAIGKVLKRELRELYLSQPSSG